MLGTAGENKDTLISDNFLWITTNGHTNISQPAKT